MLEALFKLAASKGWHYFWLAFSVAFVVVDLLTGSVFFAIYMALLAVFWAWQLNTIYKGTNLAYNRYYGVKSN